MRHFTKGLFTLALLPLVIWAGSAQAQICSVSAASGSYGSVDVLPGSAVDTSTTFTINCVLGIPFTTYEMCIQFNPGSPNTSSSARYLGNGTNYLQHELYSDAARTQAWGSWGYATTSYGSNGLTYPLTMSLLGSANATVSIYGRIKANQQTTIPGTYHWTTSSPDIALGLAGNCASQPLGSTISAGTSTWTATVSSNCNISTTALNFGTAGSLNAAISTAGTVSVQCTNTTPYSLGISNGNNVSGSQRRMRLGATTNYINYNLYTDGGYTSNWATSSSATTCSGGAGTCILGTGTGATQTIPVYALVPVQTTPAQGTYTDTDIVTVT